MRQTSVDAWNLINAPGGMIGPFQKEVYNILYTAGPLTAGEVWELYKVNNPKTERGRNEVAKRIYELCKFGTVKEIGQRQKCSVTGFTVELWDVTPNVPVKYTHRSRTDALAIAKDALQKCRNGGFGPDCHIIDPALAEIERWTAE